MSIPGVFPEQHIMSEPDEIATMSGQKLQLKMSVDYISFSAHTDYQQTSEFIRALKPPHVVRLTPYKTPSIHALMAEVINNNTGDNSSRSKSRFTVFFLTVFFYLGLSPKILVHGEQNEMARLKAALIREYEDNEDVHIEVHNPRNTEAVTLNFRGEKLAKVQE